MTHRRDSGFTLTEVVVVVATVGIIAIALAALFGIVVRTAPATTARADDARSLLGVTTWLPNDVSATPMVPAASSGPYWDDDPGTASECAGADPDGTNWCDSGGTRISAARTHTVSYRLVDAVDHSYVARIYCIDGLAPTVSKLTADLPPVGDVEYELDWKDQRRPLPRGARFGTQRSLGSDAPYSYLCESTPTQGTSTRRWPRRSRRLISSQSPPHRHRLRHRTRNPLRTPWVRRSRLGPPSRLRSTRPTTTTTHPPSSRRSRCRLRKTLWETGTTRSTQPIGGW